MSPNNEHHEEKFVGRTTELEQFDQAISPKSKIKAFLGLDHGIQPRIFLPHGIGGMGKTWLSKECLSRARKAGWKTIEIDWERADYRPSSELEMMNTIAECLKQAYGDKYIAEYLKTRHQETQVREKVRRFKIENQEKFSALVEAAKNLAEGVGGEKGKPAGALISFTGGLVNYLSAETAKAEEDFLNWLIETGKLGVDEKILYTDTKRLLARKLAGAIKEAASGQNLLILFDTCEILSADFEIWLRDAIVCPAIETGAPIIFIVSGRQDQYHERQITLENGSRKTIKGYADRISNPPPIAWDMARFAEPEIRQYLLNHDLQPHEELVRFVQESARGVPYAVQIITAALVQMGIEKVKEKFPPDENEFSQQEMLVKVTRRFLRYCMSDDTDYRRIQGLAILRNWDNGVLQAIWGAPDEKSVNTILQHLEVSYGFVLPERKLHEIVRDFVREELRLSSEATARELGKCAKTYYQPIWNELSAGIAPLGERVTEPRWRNTSVDLLNALCWQDEQEFINFLAARVIECAIFDRNFARTLLAITDDFSKPESWFSLKTRRAFNSLKQLVAKDDENAKTADFFIARKHEFELTALHLSLLHILRAVQFYRDEKYPESLESCLIAENEMADNKDSSVCEILADRYNAIAWELGLENGQTRPSESALLAMEHAVQLVPNQGSLHVSLGVMQRGLGKLDDAVQSIQFGISIGEEKDWTFNSLGNTYVALNQYDNARAAYEKAIELDPKYAHPWNGLGNVYSDLNQYDDARAAFENAIELDPKYAHPWNGLGSVYRDLNQYDDARAAFEKAIELEPQFAHPWNGLGNVYSDLNQYDDARTAYEKATELDPKYAHPWNGLGNVYSDLNQYDDARAAFEKAIELDPKLAYPWNGLGNVYRALNQYDDARAAYEKAIELDPKLAYPWNGLGNVYRALNQYDDARAAYQKAIELDPKLAYPWNGLGNVYRALNQYDDARAAYQKAIELDPKSAHPWNGLGNVYGALNQYDDARAAYQKAIELEPKFAHPWNGLGNVYSDLNQYDDARAAYEKAIELDPKSAYPWNGLGNVYSDLNQYDDARAAYQKAIELDPKLAYPWNGLGVTYNLQKEYEKALLVYQKTIELAPENGSYRSSLIGILRRLGREAEAQAQIEIARKLMDKESEYNQACFEAICGNTDNALRLLKVALEKKELSLDWAQQDPDFDNLRDDPRFKELVGLE